MRNSDHLIGQNSQDDELSAEDAALLDETLNAVGEAACDPIQRTLGYVRAEHGCSADEMRRFCCVASCFTSIQLAYALPIMGVNSPLVLFLASTAPSVFGCALITPELTRGTINACVIASNAASEVSSEALRHVEQTTQSLISPCCVRVSESLRNSFTNRDRGI